MESPRIEYLCWAKGIVSWEALLPEIGRRGMFTSGWHEVDALLDDADNAAVAVASGFKEVRAAVGGGCSEVAFADSGGILRLILLSPLHL